MTEAQVDFLLGMFFVSLSRNPVGVAIAHSSWVGRQETMIADRIARVLDDRPFHTPGDSSLLCCNSRGHFMTVQCARCGQSMDLMRWFIVDGEERPDLLELIAQGRLHDSVCPRCCYRNRLESDLLLFRPQADPVLVFSPVRGASAEECRQVGQMFLRKLVQQLGDRWKSEYYEKDGERGMCVVDRAVLPLVL